MATSIFKLVGSIFVENKDANKAIEETSKKTDSLSTKFKTGIKTVGKWGVAIAGAATGAATALLGMASASAENLDEIQKGAQQLGISYENYQKLSYACDRSGASIDDLSKGMKNITNVISGMVSEDNKAAESLEALGIATQNTDGSLRSSEEVMMEALLALSDMEDATQRNAYANQIFGASYQDLQPLLNSGSEGIKELMQNAEDLGLVMSDDAVDGGAEFKDSLDDVKASMQTMVTEIGVELMPTVKSILSWVTEHMPEIKKFCNDVFDVIKGFLTEIKPLLIAVKDLVVNVVWPAIKAIIDSGALTFALGLVTDAINGISDALQFMSGIFQLIAGDWTGGWDAIKDHIGGAFDFVMTKINPVYSLVKTIKETMEWILGADVEGKVGSIEQASAFGGGFVGATPKMASGGVISSGGTAIVGEAGAELIQMPRGATVTPLNENNNAFASMNNKLDELISVMKQYGQMGVYIDGNALVGEISAQMDTALGVRTRRAERGV